MNKIIINIIIFISGFICGLFLWLKTGIQNGLSLWQMKKLNKQLDKSMTTCGKYILKETVENVLSVEHLNKIDEFMYQNWIPKFIDDFIERIKSENYKTFDIKDMEEILIMFREILTKKRNE